MIVRIRTFVETRLLACVAAAFVAGIAAGPAALMLLGIPLFLFSRPRSLYLSVSLGALFGWWRGIPPEPVEFPRGETTLQGRVIDEPALSRLDLRPLSQEDNPDPDHRISFTLETDLARIRVYRIGPPVEILRGDHVQISGILAPPRAPTNPGQSDFSSTLRRRGIFAVLRSYDRHDLIVTPGFHLLRPVDRLRSTLREILHRHADGETAGLLSALVLGYREGLSREFTTDLQRSGTAHLLAISGQHLSLVFLIFHAATLLIGLRGRTQNGALLGILFGYTLLTGMNPAVLRSFVMIAVYLAGGLLGRRRDLVTSLGFAALLIGIFDPASIHEASFQLSFLAVLGILWIAPIFERFLGTHRWIAAPFSVSIASWLATAPVIQSVFHLVTPLVIVANLLLWPFMGTLILLGLALLLLAWSPLAAPIAAVAGGLVAVTRTVASATGPLAPVSYFYSPGPGPILLGVYFTLLAAWATACRISPSARKTLLCAPLAALLAFPLLHRTRVETTFLSQLDVGRGLCTYGEFPDGRNFVFDAGSLDHRDPGASILAPYLWSRGVRRIDTLFLSHADADHINGFRSILDRFPVGRIVTTPYLNVPLPDGVEVLRVRVEGDRPILLAPGIELLSPPVWEETGRPVPPNETSLVLRIAGRVLLTGDIMDLAAGRMLECGWDLRAHVLAAPHHGKYFARHADFAARTGASLLLVSAPEGYYSSEVVDPFRGEAFITGRHGAIEVELSDPPRVRTFRRP